MLFTEKKSLFNHRIRKIHPEEGMKSFLMFKYVIHMVTQHQLIDFIFQNTRHTTVCNTQTDSGNTTWRMNDNVTYDLEPLQ
jgi:hypothetical protein